MPLCGYGTICLPTHLLRDSWVISLFLVNNTAMSMLYKPGFFSQQHPGLAQHFLGSEPFIQVKIVNNEAP